MYLRIILFLLFFFFNDTATTEIYTLSLHDALPIFTFRDSSSTLPLSTFWVLISTRKAWYSLLFLASCCCERSRSMWRSEEHTSELQSRQYLVCRLLLEKKKNTSKTSIQCIICQISS